MTSASPTRRLTIDEVEVHRFGGLVNRSLVLPQEPLVVIAGPNEAGKSTLAELFAWLLAGPVGTAADAQRFGMPGDRIGGRLLGRLGSVPFAATGSFRVPKSGTPSHGGLQVTLDADLDAAGWRACLGGVDPQVFAAIYRCWGEQLHSGHGAQEQLSKVALAALGGRIDAHALAGDLADEVRQLTTSKAAGVHSIAALRHDLAVVEDRWRLAATTAEQWTTLGRRLSDLDEQRAHLDSSLHESRTCHRLLSEAIDLVQARDHLVGLQLQLDQFGTDASSWMHLAADPAALKAAIDELSSAASACEQAEAELGRWLAELGVTEESLARVTVTDADLTAVARATTTLHEADQLAAAAHAQAEQLRVEVAARAAATAAALAVADGATREQVARAQLGIEEQTALRTASERWSDAIAHLDEAAQRHARASAQASDAESRLSRANDAWQRWRHPFSPHDWLVSPSASASVVGIRARVPWWVPSLLVATVAAAAAAGGQVQVALGALVVAAAVALMHRPSRTSAEAVHGFVAGSEPAVTHSARDVIEAERALDDAYAAVAEARTRRDVAGTLCDAAFERLRALCEAARLPAHTVTDPASLDSTLRVWVAASVALDAERRCRSTLDAAQQAADRCRQSVQRHEHHVAELMRRMGGEDLVAVRAADEVIGSLRRAHGVWRAAGEARSRLEAAEGSYERLVAPVAADITGWRPERVLHEAEAVHERDRERRLSRTDLDTARIALETRLRGDDALRSLVEGGMTASALGAELDSRRDEITSAEHELRRISEQVGELRHTRQELSGAEQLAALAAERGTLREMQEELALRAVSAALASGVLRSVADEYERANQPALIERTLELAGSVAPGWEKLLVRAGEADRLELLVRQIGRGAVPAEQLSTGARALLYLSLRVAMADHDARIRGVSVPLICDDPLVHLDDERAARAMDVLRAATDRDRQVVVFTCHERTVSAARAVGAGVVWLDVRSDEAGRTA
jgi:uncharacterized protein YhaN